MNGFCLGCGVPLPEPFIDLGATPLANSYIPIDQADQPESKYPLAVSFCSSCYLVQLTHRVPPSTLFDKYSYFSSYSDSYLEHAKSMAAELMERCGLTSKSRVIEIASNDGYLLQYFKAAGVQVLGIEPAVNIAAFAETKGIPTRNEYFGVDAVDGILQAFGPADVLVGNNVLAHVPSINEFLQAARRCLAARGLAVFEFPDLAELLSKREFDTIYHEHVFYYSLSAIDVLANRNGLTVIDVQTQTVHGGSLRVFLGTETEHQVKPAVAERLTIERRLGIQSADAYDGFGGLVNTVREDFVTLVQTLKREGNRIAAYGAPAKGNTLLNYFGVTTDLIEFAVDRSPHKQGMLLPGSRIPVLPPQELLARQPDYAVILAWNLTTEIVKQQEEYLRKGGRFIVPIPKPVVIARDDHSEPSVTSMKTLSDAPVLSGLRT
jgi:protein-L-isoaspartate O-methyltransferase